MAQIAKGETTMKKLTAVILTLVMALALAACSGNKDEKTTFRLI